MRYDNSYYYLTDEDIADMRYESMENFAKNAVLAFAVFVGFGSGILGSLLILMGG